MADATRSAQGPLTGIWRSPLAPQIPDRGTKHLSEWLRDHGYADVAADLDRFAGASVGGLLDPTKRIGRNPIVFFNGWGDRVQHSHSANPFSAALPGSHGMEVVLAELGRLGYRSRALFGMTVGPGNWVASQLTTLDKSLILQARRRLEAFIAYADAHAEPGKTLRFVTVAHSGGNLVRDAVIKGGTQIDEHGNEYDIGPSLAHRFERAVMIATLRRGNPAARLTPGHPLYRGPTGFQPGSPFIERLNAHPVRVADQVITVWPVLDEVLGASLSPYVHHTSSILDGADREDGHVALLAPFPAHTTIKDVMAEVIARIAVDGELPWSPVASFAPTVSQLVPNPLSLGYSPLPYVASGTLFDPGRLLSPAAGFLAMQKEFTRSMEALTAGSLSALSRSAASTKEKTA